LTTCYYAGLLISVSLATAVLYRRYLCSIGISIADTFTKKSNGSGISDTFSPPIDTTDTFVPEMSK